MKTSSRQAKGGFTLIELLVAMAITLVIVLILTSVTSFAVDSYRKSRNDIRQGRIAEAAMDAIADDLESLVLIDGLDFNWLYVGEAPTGTGTSTNIDSTNPSWLLFASSVQDRYEGATVSSDDHEGGEICLVSYQLLFRDPIKKSATSDFALFSLYRQRIDPQDVADGELLGFPEGDANLATAYRNSSFGSEIDEPSNFLVENVFNMTITLIGEVTDSASGTKEVIRIPYFAETGAGGFQEIILRGNGIETQPADDDAFRADIRSIEVSLTVLTDEGSAILKNPQAPTFNLGEFLPRYSKQYTRTVRLPSF